MDALAIVGVVPGHLGNISGDDIRHQPFGFSVDRSCVGALSGSSTSEVPSTFISRHGFPWCLHDVFDLHG